LLQIARDTIDENNFIGDSLTTNLVITPDNTIRVVVTGQYKMSLMGMFGYNSTDVSVLAEAPPKGAAKLNLALVLDTTGSMSGSKITTLKSAADELVDSLTTGDPGEVMISVVPFARYVKIPMSYEGSTWLEVEPLHEHCWDKLDEDASVGCVVDPDDEDGDLTCATEVYYEHCEDLSWYGCVGSRAEPWDTRDYYGGVQLQGFAGGGSCHSELLPMTTNVADVKATIAALETEEETFIPQGLMWGWRTLTPDEPLTEANVADYAERKHVLLLMSDGMNTRSYGGTNETFNGVFHWEDDTADADADTAAICSSIKDDDIIIYSVAFEVTDADTIDMLRNCATDPSKFFDADDDIELETAFSDIGEELAQVRLSR
jgi:hypothetical protein